MLKNIFGFICKPTSKDASTEGEHISSDFRPLKNRGHKKSILIFQAPFWNQPTLSYRSYSLTYIFQPRGQIEKHKIS